MIAGLVAASSLFGATAATAGPAVSTKTPFTYEVTNTCVVPNEVLNGTGDLHLLIAENISNSGMLQSHFEARLNGLKAVGQALVLGATPKNYVVQDTFADSFGFDTTDGMPAHETFETTVHFVRQGEDGTVVMGDDLYVRFFAHITANANGAVTAFKVDPTTICR